MFDKTYAGSVNSTIDYRSDIYSLGVTLYQLLCGLLPFTTVDVVELVHSHIALEPPPLPSSVPRILSNIVNKLMSKSASDRYQSCGGILHDLEECKRRLANSHDIEWFPIATRDISRRFQISKKLYGRDVEIGVLLEAFDRVATTGSTEIILVEGYSGVGKSSLINEVQKPICLRNGYFLQGKYDQLERGVAYSAICDAFRKLIKQILGENDERIIIWQNKILKAVGNYGQLVVNVIGPELELLIGKQPPVTEITPQEAKSRFERVFENFISVVADSNHPVVLFLDDLQWIDRESVSLMRVFIERSKYLLILGALRDNEVSPDDPVLVMLEEVQNNKVATVQTINLQPLQFTIVQKWIADTLRLQKENATASLELINLVYQKTDGNPFFVAMFLRSLYEEGLLMISKDGTSWTWDLERIKQQRATDNVIDLMRSRIDQLNGDPKTVIEWASCLGNKFEISNLAYLLEQHTEELVERLEPILNSRMAFIIGDEFFFAHDRVQVCSYSFCFLTI
jgi:predicted ATPase